MQSALNRRLLFSTMLVLLMVCSLVVAKDNEGGGGATGLLGGAHKVRTTMPENVLIAASSAVGAPAYHPHMVRPGQATSYLVRAMNVDKQAATVELAVADISPEWSAELQQSTVSLKPGETSYVKLSLRPGAKLKPGDKCLLKLTANSSTGTSGSITLEAHVTGKHKIYYVSIDSLGPEYLDLNAKGNGKGSDGDWLMPNLHALLADSTYYPEHKVHLIAATDMNHASYLSGSLPGRLGIYSVNLFVFGFDPKGRPIVKTTPLDIMYWGDDGRPVTNIFNVVKSPDYGGDPGAFTAYASGKAWVPQHYLNPAMGLNRIATVHDYPDYVTPFPNPPPPRDTIRRTVRIQFGKIKDPDHYLWEDIYTMDQTIEVINNEDPDVMYILLGGVDMSGHMYGAGWDPDEWDDRGTPDNLADDISKINPHANRLAIINHVKCADRQLGRFVEFLKKRGAYEESIIVAESDHNMETNFFEGPPVSKLLAKTSYSSKKDYYLFTATQIGCIFARRQVPEMMNRLEEVLEAYRMKNPLTGEMESPMIVINREEMRTGIDAVSGEKFALPMELYSKYYIEHHKDGGMIWPDILILAKRYYQFPLVGAGLVNVGIGKLTIPPPPINVFVGGHGGPSTQHALLGVHGPGIPAGISLSDQTGTADVAPTLYRLEGYKIPECVQGKGLPKIDPTLR